MPGSTAQSRNGGRTGKVTLGGTDGVDRGGEERTRNGERGVGQRPGGKRRGEEKRQPLVRSAKEYWGFYEGGSAD